jgi:hypothetical protein
MLKSYLQKHTIQRRLLYVVVLFGVLYLVLYASFRPSHERTWELGQEALPYIEVKENGEITVTNFRNFDWQKEGSTTPRYETRTYSLDTLETVDVLISHFADFEGLAHIFLSFGFADGEHLIVSFETRREMGETFSPILGVLRQFEIIYIVGSEQDIIGVRTDVREGERVYLYPTKATPEKAKELFLALTHDINELSRKPRIYNTLFHNCTNEITRRVESISDVDFPLTWKTVLPGYFDEVLYEMELIPSNLSFDEIKRKHHIDNDTVDRHDATYSLDLRRQLD